MGKAKLFSSGQFAKMARVTRNTLHFYDDIGLLPPVLRGKNNYRYYSLPQLGIVNVIRILQELGMTLDKLRVLKDQRTPEGMGMLLASQIEEIDRKIDSWISARKLLLTLQKSIHSVLNVNEEVITVQFLPAEAIILGNLNDYSRGKDDYNALFSFYHDIHEKYPGLDLNYPVWGKFSGERIRSGDWNRPDRYYFYNPEGYDKRPAALYAIGYIRGGYGQGSELYKRLLGYIDENGFEICGDAYEEYPLNELSICDDNNYLIRIMITICKKA